jgi:UDP-sulfoquinovose synthase
LDREKVSFEEGMTDVFETLQLYEDTIAAHEDRFLPGVLEEDT